MLPSTRESRVESRVDAVGSIFGRPDFAWGAVFLAGATGERSRLLQGSSQRGVGAEELPPKSSSVCGRLTAKGANDTQLSRSQGHGGS